MSPPIYNRDISPCIPSDDDQSESEEFLYPNYVERARSAYSVSSSDCDDSDHDFASLTEGNSSEQGSTEGISKKRKKVSSDKMNKRLKRKYCIYNSQ